MPDVSIIIPAFIANEDQAAWLIEAMQSVYAQTMKSWEMIVVDDASPLEIAHQPGTNGWKLFRHEKRRGAGAARNTGIAAATAPFILCLDADDKLRPDALETLWRAHCPQVAVYGDLEYFGDRAGVHTLPEWSLELLVRGTSPLPITALHPRAAWQQIGGFDEQLPGMEDVDYWIRLAERGVCGQHIGKVIFDYRRHEDSRQAGLEANNRARMRQVVEVIQHRHRKVAGEVSAIQAKCSKCPGKGGPGTGVKMEIPPEVGSDTVRLQYVGPMRGSFRAHGFGTGAKYMVQGHGDTIIVDVRDVENLLKRSTGGKPDFELVGNVVSATPVLGNAAPLDNPPPELADITALNVKAATALIADTADLPDLAVWLAEERAQDKPRSTVIAALESRIAELNG